MFDSVAIHAPILANRKITNDLQLDVGLFDEDTLESRFDLREVPVMSGRAARVANDDSI